MQSSFKVCANWIVWSMNGAKSGINLPTRLWSTLERSITQEVLRDISVNILRRDSSIESDWKNWVLLEDGRVVEIGHGRSKYSYLVLSWSNGNLLKWSPAGSGERRWKRLSRGIRVLVYLSALAMILVKAFVSLFAGGQE